MDAPCGGHDSGASPRAAKGKDARSRRNRRHGRRFATMQRQVAGLARKSSWPSALVLAATAAFLGAWAPATAHAASPNPVTVENAHTGTTAWRIGQSGFRIASDGGGQIKGYASRTSVNKGESLSFRVSVNPVQDYSIAIY